MKEAAPAQRRFFADIQRLLSTLLARDVADPRLEGITITRLEASDRQLVTVWVYRSNEEDEQSCLRSLERMAPHFEHQLRRALPKRRLPKIRFQWDHAFEKSGDVLMLLRSLESSQ